MSTPSWLPMAISGAATCIALLTLIALFIQVRRTRFDQSVNLLFRLENDFFSSKPKRLDRKNAARDLAAGNCTEAEPILDFFETIALLVHRHALDEEMVWHTFFYWIDHYYTAAEKHIRARQAVNPLIWKDLPSLVQRLRRREQKQLRSETAPPLDLAGFLAEEQTEAPI